MKKQNGSRNFTAHAASTDQAHRFGGQAFRMTAMATLLSGLFVGARLKLTSCAR